MARLRIPPDAVADGRVSIDGPELRHLRTFRLRAGAELVVFDGSGAEYTVRLSEVGRHRALATVLRVERPEREASVHIVLAPALLKGPRMDTLVEKATELGVARLAPVLTERVVARGEHRERWERIVAAAAKQCGRTRLPVVAAPCPLADRLAESGPALRLVAWEAERTTRITDLPVTVDAALLVTGPEGGFTTDEIDLARARDCRLVGLGARVLRAETAAIVAVALCLQRWDAT
jgi:16S rRNA (uracil1498-N3)-methyltransferase